MVLTTGGIQGWTWDLRKNEFTWVNPWGDSKQECRSVADFLAVCEARDRWLCSMPSIVRQAARESTMPSSGSGAAKRSCWWLGRGTVICDSSRPAAFDCRHQHQHHGAQAGGRGESDSAEKREDARRESERANRLKDEFLAILSHELRTPLNAITGWAHMLQAGGLDQETQAKAVETINRNALLQARLISDLLDVSRIVSGKLRLDLRPVDLPSIIQAALDTIRPAAEAKEIHIDVATDAPSGSGSRRRRPVATGYLESPVECHQVRASPRPHPDFARHG